MPKNIIIKKLTKPDYITELLNLMKEYKLETTGIVKKLREGKEVVITVDDKYIDVFADKLSKISEYDIEDTSKTVDGFGVLSIFAFDLFLVVSLVEILTNTVKLRDTILQLSSSSQFTALFIIIIKLFLVFVLLKGFVNNFSTTFIGQFYKVILVGDSKKVVYTMMVPVVGFYMATSGYGRIFELIGLFFIIFFTVSMIVAYNLFDIKFQKKEE